MPAISKPVTSKGMKLSHSIEFLSEVADALVKGDAWTEAPFPLTDSGAYSDPYNCHYYPLHYLACDLIKAGFFGENVKQSPKQAGFTITGAKKGDARLYRRAIKSTPKRAYSKSR